MKKLTDKDYGTVFVFSVPVSRVVGYFGGYVYEGKPIQVPKAIKVWISKDGDKIENMSFFPNKKSAEQFRNMTKQRDRIVEAKLLIHE